MEGKEGSPVQPKREESTSLGEQSEKLGSSGGSNGGSSGKSSGGSESQHSLHLVKSSSPGDSRKDGFDENSLIRILHSYRLRCNKASEGGDDEGESCSHEGGGGESRSHEGGGGESRSHEGEGGESRSHEGEGGESRSHEGEGGESRSHHGGGGESRSRHGGGGESRSRHGGGGESRSRHGGGGESRSRHGGGGESRSRHGGGGESRSRHGGGGESRSRHGGGGESRSRHGGGGESRSHHHGGRESHSSGVASSAPTRRHGKEYKTLKISKLGSQLSDGQMEDRLLKEFRCFGDVSVRICHPAGSVRGDEPGDERVAFVNFRSPEDARAAKHSGSRLVLFDKPLKIEAVYETRSQRRSRFAIHKYIYPFSSSMIVPPERRHRHASGGGGGHHRSLSPDGTALGYRDYHSPFGHLSPLPPLPRDLERARDYPSYERVRSAHNLESRVGAGADAGAFREVDKVTPKDDQQANRTLFLGNLDITMTESDLRKAFDCFGVIRDIRIKRPFRGQTCTYGFIRFENPDMSYRAKLAMSGKIIIQNPVKIGYGKVLPSTRLWIGGLVPWVSLTYLAVELDRFGTIRTIDYRKGDDWAYIQYESLDAAHAAWTHMRGFPLGSPDYRLRVDFADPEPQDQQQYRQPPPLAHELVRDASEHEAPDPLTGACDTTLPVLYRDHDKDLCTDTDWVPPSPRVWKHSTGTAAAAVSAYEPPDSLDHGQDGSSLDQGRGERDLPSSKDLPRKRSLPEESRGWHLVSDLPQKRHSAPPGLSSDLRNSASSDSERSHHLWERPSLITYRQHSLEKSQGDQQGRKHSASVEHYSQHWSAAPTDRKSPLKRKDQYDGDAASTISALSKLKSPLQRQEDATASVPAASPRLCLAWQGILLLKKSSFPSNMHLLQGNLQVASHLLVESSTGDKLAQLQITQRLRVEQHKLDEITRRIKGAGPNGYVILLTVPRSCDSTSSSSLVTSDTATSTQRSFRSLVAYLKQKQAAGLITLPVGDKQGKVNTGILYAFPPCEFSQQFLDSPAKALIKSEDSYLVTIIVCVGVSGTRTK